MARETGLPLTALNHSPHRPSTAGRRRATGRGAAAGDSLPEWQAKRERSVSWLAEAQAALDRGDVGLAERFARAAQELRVPDAVYRTGDPRPWMILMEITRRNAKTQSPPPAYPSNVQTASAVQSGFDPLPLPSREPAAPPPDYSMSPAAAQAYSWPPTDVPMPPEYGNSPAARETRPVTLPNGPVAGSGSVVSRMGGGPPPAGPQHQAFPVSLVPAEVEMLPPPHAQDDRLPAFPERLGIPDSAMAGAPTVPPMPSHGQVDQSVPGFGPQRIGGTMPSGRQPVRRMGGLTPTAPDPIIREDANIWLASGEAGEQSPLPPAPMMDLGPPTSIERANESPDEESTTELAPTVNLRSPSPRRSGQLPLPDEIPTTTSAAANVSEGLPRPEHDVVDQPSEGHRLYIEGRRALERHDTQLAREKFLEAWQHRDDLDPATRQQLQDNMQLVRRSALANDTAESSSSSGSGGAGDSVKDLLSEIAREQAAVRVMKEKDPTARLGAGEEASRKDRANGTYGYRPLAAGRATGS